MPASDAIAVIGMGCRFPGARNVDEFWNNLKDGVESLTRFSDHELLGAGADPSQLSRPDYVKAGYVLEDADLFDAGFFGYSPKDAELMDPQHRLFLETAWQALEDGGYATGRIQGAVGVFGGARMSSYLVNILNAGRFSLGNTSDLQALLANDKDYLASRVSFKLDLKGPSVTVQSACSTSLVAVHMACDNLLSGACDMALAGGVSLNFPQQTGYLYQEGMILSPDGHCRAFDAGACGVTPGNGVGVVLLKRLEDAIRDRDLIHAVVLGSAVNNDGANKIGYTTPSVDGQVEVVKEAQAVSDVSPGDLTYIETHGTGTPLGDPVEIQALKKIFGTGSEKQNRCALGSVKTNIGHLDTAAGIAGFIKTVLSMKHGMMVPSLNYKRPNPKIDFDETPFYVNTEFVPWRAEGQPRRAGVSSFGFGGTNAHVILEEAPASVSREMHATEVSCHLLTLSAKSRAALDGQIRSYHTFLEQQPDLDIGDICYTASSCRQHFDHRFTAVATDTAALKECLEAAGNAAAGLEQSNGHTSPGWQDPVFLFTGQGAQYTGMGEELYRTQPVFRKEMDNCDRILEPLLGRSILSLMFDRSQADALDQTANSQPALFALEYSLARMWMSWGIRPGAVLGHSVGEFAAACIAGVFSLEDGLKLVAERGRLMQACPGEGAMASVFLPEQEVMEYLAPYLETVAVAAVNGPDHTVISGPAADLETISAALARQEVTVRNLSVSHAFHSPMMAGMADAFGKIARDVRFSDPRIRLISNVTGRVAAPEEICTPGYWARHIMAPVRFASGMETLKSDGFTRFLETGPAPVLLTMGQRCLPEDFGSWLPSLKRNTKDWHQVMISLGRLYESGARVDWEAFYRFNASRKITLPTYAFDRQRYWAAPGKDPAVLQEAVPDALPEGGSISPALWGNLVSAGIGRAAELPADPDAYANHRSGLDALCVSYIVRVLRSLGGFEAPDDTHSVASLMDTTGILPEYTQLTSRLLNSLVLAGKLSMADGMYTGLKDAQTGKDHDLIKALKQAPPYFENWVAFISRCGDRLGPMLTGSVNPRDVLFPGGSLDMIEGIYQDNDIARYFNGILVEIAGQISASAGENTSLRVLEIGAGTGATTRMVLPGLSNHDLEYTYTDVSPVFLNHAREKFGDYTCVKYRVLDIESLPADQSFEPQGYDVVIAANVLHATRNLDTTMANVFSLMAPGGILLLREITTPLVMFDLTFGPVLNPLTDQNLRQGQPFLSANRWQELLAGHGFDLSHAFPGPSSKLDEHIIIARSRGSVRPDVTPAFTRRKAVKNPLSGRRLASPLPIFETDLSLGTFEMAKHHRVFGEVILPGAALMEMAVRAGGRVLETAHVCISDLVFKQAMPIPEGHTGKTVQLIMDPVHGDRSLFRIFSRNDDGGSPEWTLHASGAVSGHTPDKGGETLDAVRSRLCKAKVADPALGGDGPQEVFFEDEAGFRMHHLWKNSQEALAKFSVEADLINGARAFQIHPLMLNPLTYAMSHAFPGEGNNFYIPVRIDQIHCWRPLTPSFWCHIRSGTEALSGGGLSADAYLFDGDGNLIAEFTGVCLHRVSPDAFKSNQASDEMAQVFYRRRWHPVSADGEGPVKDGQPKRPGLWLIFSDRGETGKELANFLTRQGNECIRVYADTSFTRRSTGVFGIDPGRPEDYERLLEQCAGKSSELGIFHLWSLDAVGEDELSAEDLNRAETEGCLSLVHLVQSLADRRGLTINRLCVVTRGAEVLPDEITGTGLAQAPASGLMRVISSEHPELNCLSVDVDGLDSEAGYRQLARVAYTGIPGGELAIRKGVIYLPQLVHSQPTFKTGSDVFHVDGQGTHLITGAFGGLGIELARWLAAGGARFIVMMGRHTPGADAEKAISALEDDGVRVVRLVADVSHFDDLSGAFDRIPEQMPALKGVFHLAGQLTTGAVLGHGHEEFRNVLSPKVAGAWHLHLLTRDIPLDFFVMFSSSSTLWGVRGTGGYTAANSFLDALARHRRNLGLAGLSINWGTWSRAGAAAKLGLGDALANQGFRSMSPEKSLDILGRLLGCTDSQIGVMDIDWERFLSRFPDGDIPPVFSELEKRIAGQAGGPGEIESASSAVAISLEALLKMPARRQQESLRAYLRLEISRLLHLDESRISDDQNLIQLGLDSLVFIELSRTLEKDLGVRAAPEKIFENPTVAAMAVLIAPDMAREKKIAVLDQKTVQEFVITPDRDGRHEPFELTDIQQAYWIGRGDTMALGNIACHVYVEIDAPDLDLDRYNRAWQRLVERHEMLRTVILPEGRQKILASVPAYRIHADDLRDLPGNTSAAALVKTREQMSHQVLDPGTWPVFDIRVSVLAGGISRIHLSLDMLVVDALSVSRINSELHQFYHDENISLPPLELSFRDYVLAEKTFETSDLYLRSRNYWMSRLTDIPPGPELPLAVNPDQLVRPEFTRRTLTLEADLWQQLKSNAAGFGLTPSGLLLACYAEILGRWSKTRKFTINMTIFNRLPVHPQVNDIIGDFTSLIMLVVDNSNRGNFVKRAQKIQAQFWKDVEHRHFSGIRVLREMARANPSENVMMPVIFTSNIVYGDLEKDGAETQTLGDLVYSVTQTPQVWLDHQITEKGDALVLDWDAVDALFPAGVLDDMFNAYEDLLKRLAVTDTAWQENHDPKQLPGAVEAPVREATLDSLFADQAGKQPEALALISGKIRFSYRDLAARAGRIADLVGEQKIRPGTLVAVVMEKGWEQVAAVLGILRAGAAYLPIDPAVPPERLHYLMEDCAVRLALTQSVLDRLLKWPETVTRISVDNLDFSPGEIDPGDAAQQRNGSHSRKRSCASPEDLAYVIHTSGSTGLPKGVMIDHRGAVNTVLDVNRRFGVGPEDKVLALSALNFDLSVFDIFGTLAAGGTIVLPDPSGGRDPFHWTDLIMSHDVTIWNSVPALMQMLTEYLDGVRGRMAPSLRLAMLSGDWIPLDLPEKIRSLGSDADIYSLGGATEASIWSICYPIKTIDPDWRNIPYGQAMDGQSVVVLNEKMEVCPVWVTGRLYIGGIGLALGYWGDEKKTSAAFIRHPESGIPLYCTGDLGRLLPDGNIEFLGREDQQVKVNGFRIEPGEVECAILRFPDIEETVVKAIGEGPVGRQLTAFVRPAGIKMPDPDKLKAFLRDTLPAHLVPARIVVMETFPLSSNGKVDRKALQPPVTGPVPQQGKTPSALAEEVLEICSTVLNTGNICAGDNFFEMGGNSLLGIRFINALRDKYALELPLRRLFEASDLNEIVAEVEAAKQTRIETEHIEEGVI